MSVSNLDVSASKLARRGPNTVEILRLRIDLVESAPTVTRTILIRATSPMSVLHKAIQTAMGWEDCHLHEFEKDGVRYGPIEQYDDLDDADIKSERKKLDTLFRSGEKTLRYLYDFGDCWYHTITLEETLPADLSLRRPTCIAGENACPPEDVGGMPGYMDYLEAVLDPQHKEHAERTKWRGAGFHPSHFSVEEAETRMQKIFRR